MSTATTGMMRHRSDVERWSTSYAKATCPNAPARVAPSDVAMAVMWSRSAGTAATLRRPGQGRRIRGCPVSQHGGELHGAPVGGDEAHLARVGAQHVR